MYWDLDSGEFCSVHTGHRFPSARYTECLLQWTDKKIISNYLPPTLPLQCSGDSAIGSSGRDSECPLSSAEKETCARISLKKTFFTPVKFKFKIKVRTWTGIWTSDLQISSLVLYHLSVWFQNTSEICLIIIVDMPESNANHINQSCCHLPVSCRSLVDRCGSLGSCKPQI